MNLPTAVLAAMALCNQHVVATRSDRLVLVIAATTTLDTLDTFTDAYAWEAPYQAKCKEIQNYVVEFQAWLDKKASDADQAEQKAAKAAEQPALDKGIAALGGIKHMNQ